MANKAMLPLLYSRYKGSTSVTKNLLVPSFNSYDEAKKNLGNWNSLVAKPLYGREGTGVLFGQDYSSEASFKAAIRNGTILGPSIF